MSAVATPHSRVSGYDRLLAAVPLASVYVWLSMVYSVEAWKRNTPWLFTDELEFTQLARSIAETGHAARRGEPHSFGSLYNVVVSLFWHIDAVAAAFSAIKYFDVLVMTSVLFPTYFLARLVVGKWPALFAATAAAAIPSLAYSSWIVEETFAYPYATLCFLLIAKALLVRTRGWIAGAIVASLVAPAVRVELVVVPILFVLAALFMVWSSDWAKAKRVDWTWDDWLGFLALVAGAIILLSAIASSNVREWRTNTEYNWTKARVFQYGDWAAGALAVGLGVVPMVLGLAALVRARGERWSQELRAFRSVAAAGIIGFGLYTAMKAAYLSQAFESRVEERNLIYISPLLFIGTAWVLEQRRVDPWALGAAAAYVLFVVLDTPLFVGGGLYSDALGLAIFQQANRYWYLNEGQARWILVALVALAVAASLLLPRLRAPLAIALGMGILAWNVTGEIAAAAGSVTVGRDVSPALNEPFTWVDDATRLKPTLYLGQQVTDQNPVWLLEFWNRSIKTVSSLDGTIKGPGPSGAPNITPTGKLYWTADPSNVGRTFDYAVEDWPCIDFAGTRVRTHFYRGGAVGMRQWRLIRLTKPNRLRAMCVGVQPDGWSGENDSRYFRFAAKRPGALRIDLSRAGFRGSPVDIQIGTIVRARNQPELGRVTQHVRTRIETGKLRRITIRTPARPFAVRVVIADKFVPSKVDPSSGDVRTLGAQVSFRYSAQR